MVTITEVDIIKENRYTIFFSEFPKDDMDELCTRYGMPSGKRLISTRRMEALYLPRTGEFISYRQVPYQEYAELWNL